MDRNYPIVFIVGPTGSGKTDLAITIAKEFDGEIICADSRTVYRGLDIGTAKPSRQQLKAAVHWGLDLIEVDQNYSAAEFKRYATDKIEDITSRDKLAIVVGGSGLYVDGLLFDYQFGDLPDESLRKSLHMQTTEELIEYCKINNIELPNNFKNKRHLIRAIEQNGINIVKNKTPMPSAVIVGISTENETLINRIAKRSREMVEHGVIEETNRVAPKYGWSPEPLNAGVYKLVRQYNNSEISLEDLIALQAQYDKQLVKKQLTWFKRNQYIKWLDLDSAYKYLSQQLAKYK